MAEPSSERPNPTAIVAAGDDETRVLLRGLLRLHHFLVVGEASGASEVLHLLAEDPPDLLVGDVNLAEGTPQAMIDGARRLAPRIRIVITCPPPRSSAAPAPPTSADLILSRPFRIHEFAEAIAPAAGPWAGVTPGPR